MEQETSTGTSRSQHVAAAAGDSVATEAARLAVALRAAQWEIDDAAHRLPEGRLADQEAEALAAGLEDLAQALRLSVGRHFD